MSESCYCAWSSLLPALREERVTVTRASEKFLEHREKQQQAESGTVGAET